MASATEPPIAGNSEGAALDGQKGFGTRAYRTYVLNALLLVYVLNFIDRGLLSVVARPLKAEIEISDTAWGLLTGFGFALLYSIVGLPLARIAERRNRVWIMAICLALWSIMTALCAFATDIEIGGLMIGGFWVLLFCRIGVGLGEAGCTPPANSLIADYYPPRARSSALGVYAMGVMLGGTLANLIGGPITDMFGWRAAFMILGLPGVAVAVLLVLTIKEPPRGYTDPPKYAKPKMLSLSQAMGELRSKPSFWAMVAGATIAGFVAYGVTSFQSLYLQRSFDLSAGQAALWINTPSFAAGAIGTVFLGWAAQKLAVRWPAAVAWLASCGLFLCVPFYILAFTTSNLTVCLIGLSIGKFFNYGYLTAQYTISQGVVSARVRATATAVLLFVINFLGYGLGPLFAGLVSDFFFTRDLALAGFATLTRSMCDAAQQGIMDASPAASGSIANGRLSEILAQLPAPVTSEQYAFCLTANASSTQSSMLIITSIYILSAVCFAICARLLKRDVIG